MEPANSNYFLFPALCLALNYFKLQQPVLKLWDGFIHKLVQRYSRFRLSKFRLRSHRFCLKALFKDIEKTLMKKHSDTLKRFLH